MSKRDSDKWKGVYQYKGMRSSSKCINITHQVVFLYTQKTSDGTCEFSTVDQFQMIANYRRG